jgi:acetoin utilization protein AcuB
MANGNHRQLRDPVARFMTFAPHTIGQEQPLALAHSMMRKWNVRHLPVLHGGELVGILSQRDALKVGTLPDVDPEKVTVEEAMTSDVYTVPPETSLAQVASEMAEHKYGSVVVMSGTHLAGIFTAIDAIRALLEIARAEATP